MCLAKHGMRRWILAVSLALLCWGADVQAISRRACRRACSTQLAPCALETTRALRRACRRAVIRACRSEGVAVCSFDVTTTTTTRPSSSTTTTLPSGPACDPSYPTLCLPSPPPNLDCGQIEVTNFPVVGGDPHGLDGDGDGIGCEQ